MVHGQPQGTMRMVAPEPKQKLTSRKYLEVPECTLRKKVPVSTAGSQGHRGVAWVVNKREAETTNQACGPPDDGAGCTIGKDSIRVV